MYDIFRRVIITRTCLIHFNNKCQHRFYIKTLIPLFVIIIKNLVLVGQMCLFEGLISAQLNIKVFFFRVIKLFGVSTNVYTVDIVM